MADKIKELQDILRVEGVKAKGYGIIPKAIMIDRDLSVTAKAIYSYFCSLSGRGETVFPGREKILSDLRISKNAYYKGLNELVDNGYIVISMCRDKNKRFLHNVYTITARPSKYQNPPKDASQAAMYCEIMELGLDSQGYGIIPYALTSDPRMKSQPKATYGYLSSHIGQNQSADLDPKLIGYHLGIAKAQTVQEHMKKLVTLNYITVTRLYENGRLISKNRYTLVQTPDDLPDASEAPQVLQFDVALVREILDTEKQDAKSPEILDAEKRDMAPSEILDTEKGDMAPEQILDTEKRDTAPEQILDTEKGDMAPEQILDTEKRDTAPEQILDTEKGDMAPHQILNTEKQDTEKQDTEKQDTAKRDTTINSITINSNTIISFNQYDDDSSTRERVKAQIGYDRLQRLYFDDDIAKRILDDIVQAIAEVYNAPGKHRIIIARERVFCDWAQVKLQAVQFRHVVEVMERILARYDTIDPKNHKSYLLTAICQEVDNGTTDPDDDLSSPVLWSIPID